MITVIKATRALFRVLENKDEVLNCLWCSKWIGLLVSSISYGPKFNRHNNQNLTCYASAICTDYSLSWTYLNAIHK